MSTLRRTLTVLPDADRVEQALVVAALESDFVDAAGFISIAELVERCEPGRFLARAPLNALAGRWLLSSLGRDHAREAFGSWVEQPGFARAAWELISHLKLQGIAPEAFSTAADLLIGSRGERARAVARLWGAYETSKLTLGLADPADFLAGASARLLRELPRRLSGFAGVEVRGLVDLPPLRIELLHALAVACEREKLPLRVSLPSPPNPEVNALIAEVLGQLEKRWANFSAELFPDGQEDRPFSVIGARLFGASTETFEAGGLEAFCAPTPREEFREIARRVRAQLDAGVSPDAIAVVFRDLAAEAEGLNEALAAVGVPARVRLGAPLGTTTPGRLALGLGELAEDHFPVAQVLPYLESGYAQALNGTPEGAAAWVREAGVRDDLLGANSEQGAWAVRLGALEERLGRGGDKKSASEVKDLRTQVERLRAAAQLLKPVDTLLGHLNAWRAAVEAIGLGEGLQRRTVSALDQPLVSGAVERALARDQAAGEGLEALAKDFAHALELAQASKRNVSRRDFGRWLHDAAGDFNLHIKGPRTGAVRLLDARQLAEAKFTHVFVGGLVDGRFPGRPQPLPLLSDEERTELNSKGKTRFFRHRAGEGPNPPFFRQAEDRLLFHLCLAASTARVTLSYSRFDSQGRELNTSAFLTETQRLAGFTLDVITRTSAPDLERVSTRGELEARVALETLSAPATRLSVPGPHKAALEAQFAREPWFKKAAALSKMETERLLFFSSADSAPGPFSGGLTSAAARAELNQRFSFDREHPASAAQLGTFGNCGFQGFAKYALRLAPGDVTDEEVSPMARGNFWHSVMELFFPAIKAAGLLGKPLHQFPPGEFEKHALNAISQAAARVHQSQPTGHPLLWKVDQDKARAMLERLLSSDHLGLVFRERGWLPQDMERVFGRSQAEAPWNEVKVPAAREGEEDVFLAGKIDRIDVGPEGAGVVDYKTSSYPPDGLLVRDFQLPLYLYVVSQVLGVRNVDAALLGLRKASVANLPKFFEDPAARADLVADDLVSREKLGSVKAPNFANAVHELVAKIQSGQLGARPSDCGYCEFQRVCRISNRTLLENESTP